MKGFVAAEAVTMCMAGGLGEHNALQEPDLWLSGGVFSQAAEASLLPGISAIRGEFWRSPRVSEVLRRMSE